MRSSITLAGVTGVEPADTVLAGTIGVFFTCFPDQIKAAYITGSLALGTARKDSDLDLFFVFRDTLAPADMKKFNALRGYCQQLTPLSLDYKPCDEASLIRTGMPVLTQQTLFLYGEDISSQLPQEPVGFKDWAMHSPFWLFSRARRNPPHLKYPLTLPKPDEAFGGYDSRRNRLENGSYVKSSKMLYTNCLAIGVALIGAATGTFTFKSNLAQRYREVIGDAWSDFIDEIYQVTVKEQAYAIPDDPTGQERLAQQCRRMLDFENHFLEIYRQYLLDEIKETGRPSLWTPLPALAAPLGMPPQAFLELIGPDRYERKNQRGEDLVRVQDVHRAVALSMLTKVIYPDSEVLDTVKALGNDPDPLLKQVAPAAVGIIEGALL